MGFVCAAETPEGQSVGVVKNICYMSHITIASLSSPIYEVSDEYIKNIEDFEPEDVI